MKKYFEATPNLDGLKEKIIVLKDGEDRKTLIAVIALVAAVLIAVTAGVVYLLKTRMDDEYEEDWDYDWMIWMMNSVRMTNAAAQIRM